MTVHYPWRKPEQPKPTARKALAHILLHSQRHWAQLATLVRAAGFPSGFSGICSSALRYVRIGRTRIAELGAVWPSRNSCGTAPACPVSA